MDPRDRGRHGPRVAARCRRRRVRHLAARSRGDGRPHRPGARRRSSPGPPRPGEVPVLWALGWTLPTLAGIDVDQQYTIFGAAGAVTFAALSGVLLHALLLGRSATGAAVRRPDHRIGSTP